MRTIPHTRASASRAVARIALLLGATHAPAHAHDFWLQPEAFHLSPMQTAPFTLQVGHGPDRQRSPIPARRIVRFDALGGDGAVTDLRDRLRPGAGSSDGDLAFAMPGVHLLVLATDDAARSHLPALRFNDYAAAEGLSPALAARERTRRTTLDATERYRRVAKALVRVGAPDAHAPTPAMRAVGLPLEIVPEADPYAEPPAPTLPIRVLYEGAPLPGARVKLTELEHDDAPLETRTSDADGRASFALQTHGTWLLNVVWTRALPDSADADFETVFSSLSFGFDAQAH